jgi:hypothetical protein
MRRRKVRLGVECLRSEILRALVAYNARMFNRVQDRIAASRTSDEVFDELFAVRLQEVDDDVPYEDEEPDDWDPQAQGTPDESVFESRGLDLLLEAVRRRLESRPIGSCDSERLALELDFVGLTTFERDSILAISNTPIDRLVERTVLVGLLNREMPAFRDHLESMDISEEIVPGAWVRELDQAIQEAISARFGNEAELEAARELSDLKGRHLFKPLSTLARTDRGERGAPKLVGDAHAPSADLIEATREASAEQAGGSSRVRLSSSQGDLGAEGGRRAPIRMAALATVLALILLALVNLILDAPSTVAELGPRELSDASRYLASAYRDGNGEGRLLIGRVDPEWHGLSNQQKRRAALEMGRRLDADGISKILVYTEDMRIAIDYAGGQLRVPKTAPEPVTPRSG